MNWSPRSKSETQAPQAHRTWVAAPLALALLFGSTAASAVGGNPQNVGTSAITAASPAVLDTGVPTTLCFTANINSPDAEYTDRVDLDLPDGWTLGTVSSDSSPSANGCTSARPPAFGTAAGNVVFWQSAGTLPTSCGAWNGSPAGTDFQFCVEVTVPDCSGAPWDIPWNIAGDGWGAAPHSATGTHSSIACNAVATQTVTSSVGTPAGAITPLGPQVVAQGGSISFTLTPNAGYAIDNVSGTCAGTLSGTTYTVNPVTADCTVIANFIQSPDIDVSPAALASTQAVNTTTTQTLGITNNGGLDLNWSIDEQVIPRFPTIQVGALVPQPAAEVVGAVAPAAQPPTSVPEELWRRPEALLHDNGPMVTDPGAGAGGADVSALQTAMGNNILGFGHAVSSGFRVADDFTVPAGGWTVNEITFFAYQTGSTTTSTMDSVNLRIWDGVPGAVGSNIVFGDTTTNRLTGSIFSGVYRAQDTALTDANRPIMASTAAVGVYLPAGTYWVDWQTGGTLASGPWAVPVTLAGQTQKPGSNAMQWDGSAWGPVIDSGSSAAAQDMAFVIDGEVGEPACYTPADAGWLAVSPANGITAGSASSSVTVSFDSTGLTVGNTYSANLCVRSDDPDTGPGNGTALVVVPVTLNVTAPVTHTVTSSVGTPAGTITPLGAQTVTAGNTISFTLTPNAGHHIDSVGGTCGGTLAGTTYTTNAITGDCTVIANFAPDDIPVATSVPGGHGSITGPATVPYGGTGTFTLTPDPGYAISSVTGCGGSLSGAVYTTGPITGACTITVSFVLLGGPAPTLVPANDWRMLTLMLGLLLGGAFVALRRR